MKFPIISIDESLKLLGGDSRKLPDMFQYMVNNIVANHQGDWPLSLRNWRRFIEDVERFNEHYGFNLQINLSNTDRRLEMSKLEILAISITAIDCYLIIVLILWIGDYI